MIDIKIYRLLSIISVLANNNKITISELANKLEVSKRTIYRDLESLTIAGIPIVSYSGYNGGISIAEDFKIDKNVLSTNDIKNILLGLNSILPLEENKEVKYLISRLMPKEMRNINEESDIIIDLSNWYDDDFLQNMMNTFRKAIVNMQYVYLDYHSKSIVTERKIEPYKLVFKETDWYLYAYCLMRKDFRLFKLTRVSAYKLSTDTFDNHRDIDIDKICQLPSKRGNHKSESVKEQIILECRSCDKEFIIEKFGAENLKCKDEKFLLEFYSNNLKDTADLIISLQDKVKVIQPLELRSIVFEKIKSMYKVYEG